MVRSQVGIKVFSGKSMFEQKSETSAGLDKYPVAAVRHICLDRTTREPPLRKVRWLVCPVEQAYVTIVLSYDEPLYD
jgi:hypothetical protein